MAVCYSTQLILLLILLNICVGLGKHGAKSKFLIISAPRDGKVAYYRIPSGSSSRAWSEGKPHNLITSGLIHPQGIAVKKDKLYVADPDSRKILSYSLISQGGHLVATNSQVAMDDVEARWVAVDGKGNLYATDEPENRILKVSAKKLASGNPLPEVIYDGASLSSVSNPGGIVADNFHTYWVNKAIGTQAGSLIQAAAASPPSSFLQSVRSLSKNTDKSYGVCMALDNIYYTQPESTVTAVKKDGSTVSTVSAHFHNPRGCTWDGDGTVYVADRGAGAIFSFPGNMKELAPSLIQKKVDFEDAFGVAVFSAARAWSAVGALVLTAVVSIAHLSFATAS